MINKDLIIKDCNIKDNKEITLFADSHFSSIVNFKRLNQIKKSVLQNKPNFICVLGDIIDLSNYLDSKENCKSVLNYFEELQQVSPVIISLGSHDYIRLEHGISPFDYNEKFFRELNSLGNTFVLNNEAKVIGNVRFLGYFFNYEYYCNAKNR